MTSFYTQVVNVDSTGVHPVQTNNVEPIRVKNTGINTVYLGRIQQAGSDPVYLPTAYPLVPGESVVIANAVNADTYSAGVNTVDGTSTLIVLGVN